MSPRTTPPPELIPGASWIPLTKGLFALVDDSDVPLIDQWYWTSLVRPGRSHYAFRRQNGITIYLHRFIMNVPTGMEVDHRDGRGWDCRRLNLRICTHGQNQHNYSKCSRTTTSVFKGVHFSASKQAWIAQIKMNGTKRHIGEFESEIEAAKAYDTASIAIFGEFAKPNMERTCA